MSNDRRQVLVTGVGIYGALGDAGATHRALAEDRSAVAMIHGDDALPPAFPRDGFPASPAAERCPTSPHLTDRKLLKYMSPASKMAVLAAGDALSSAGLLDDDSSRAQTALYVTTDLIAFDLSTVWGAIKSSRDERGELDLGLLGKRGLRRCHPLIPFKMLLNMPLGLISIVYGLSGDNGIFYPAACAASALEVAHRGLRTGRFHRALVGGTAHLCSLLPLGTFWRSGLLAANVEAATPFSSTHQGLAPADGASFLLLESAEAAQARGAHAIAQLDPPLACFGVGDRAPARLGAALGAAPDAILSTGSLNAATDRALEAARDALEPKTTLSSFDGPLGHQGAASLFSALALGAMQLDRTSASARSMVVHWQDPVGPRLSTCLRSSTRRS